MNTETQKIINLIKQEVIPAIGCTEPIAVSLCTAKATELLGEKPEKIELFLSANIIKNAMGVGIPGTGMIGLPIAVALGALIGKSEYQLEVLKECNNEAVENGKKYIDENRIFINLKDTKEKLFIEVHCSAGDKTSCAIIATNHTHYIYLEENGKVLLKEELSGNNDNEEKSDAPVLTLRKVWDFAMDTPLDDIRFILETKKLNDSVSKESLKNNFGHQIGRIMNKSTYKGNFFADSTYTHIVSRTAAACDARMAGCSMAVMSNSGSGNQGISATMPIVAYCDDYNCSEEQLIRALTLSHLTVIYIKQSLGRLSALCGCVVAATGSACGLTYLLGGDYNKVEKTVKNMAATLTGMLCDGAKPSCALKVASGVSSAVLCSMLAMEDQGVTKDEGIITDSVDDSIKNMTLIGREGMMTTDELVLHIMTHK